MKKLIDFFARQALFSELITFLVIGFGVYSLMTIKRETFPNVQYDIITVYTIFPGAAASEVEKLITNPLELDLKEIEGIKKMVSVSTEGRSGITLVLDADQTNQVDAKADVQDVLDRVRDLPDQAEDPVVTAVESKIFPVVEVGVIGGRDEFHRKEAARYLESEIEALSEVARVDLRGEREYEIRVEISSKNLRRYQLSLTEVSQALESQNISIPGGPFTEVRKGQTHDVIVRTEGQFDNIDDVKNTVVRSNDLGRPIRLGDVADVRLDLKKAVTTYRVNQKDAIRLVVSKKEKADAIHLIDKLKIKLSELENPVLDGIEFEYLNDLSLFIRRRLGVLSNNLLVGLLLVVLVLSVFLPFRVSLVTAVGIPFSFLGCISYFSMMDISLNLITMMGLIIVIGMLVDDAVVVTENAIRRMEEGEEPMEAAIRGTQQIWKPVFASVMTTVLAFYPMTIMSGIFGKFIAFIPLGVICALLISLVECYFILPYHIGRWVSLKSIRREVQSGFRYNFEKTWERITNFYGRCIYKVTRFRYLALVSFVCFLGFSFFVAGTQMKTVLFPSKGIDVFIIKMKGPVGTSLVQTSEWIRPVEKMVKEKLLDGELLNMVTTIGGQQSRPDEAPLQGSHYGQIIVFLTPEEERSRDALEIIENFRQTYRGDNPEFSVSFEKQSSGPPVGKPISIGVQGKDYESIMPMVNEIMDQLKDKSGVQDLENNYASGKDQLIVKVNPVEARAVGLSAQSVGVSVLNALEGFVPTTIRRLEDEIDVRVSLPESEKSGSRGIENLKVMNTQGRLIPLKRIANFERVEGIESYFHMDNVRQVTVSGDIDDEKITAIEVAQSIEEQRDYFAKKYPGLTLDLGGEDEDTKESLESLMRAFVMALVLIYFLLILTFQSFLWPVIIILAIPLGAVSVIWALFVHGMPLSFMGMLGVVALAGVIVNNAIVLVDFVREERGRGLSRRESIIKAAKNRLRPIFLTTFTTVCGIVPTAYGIGGSDPFVVPIAISLGWGMFIGSILSSLFLPAFIAILDDFMGLGRRKA